MRKKLESLKYVGWYVYILLCAESILFDVLELGLWIKNEVMVCFALLVALKILSSIDFCPLKKN